MTPMRALLAPLAAFVLAACAAGPALPPPVDDAVGAAAALPEDRAAIDALRADPRVNAAFATITAMDAKNVERLIRLNEIPAPPFGEGPRGQAFAADLSALGLQDVTIAAVGNVIGVRPGVGEGPTVALVAHLDTVFPAETDVTVRREGDTFIAPGVGDNTRGMVVLLSLLEAMQTHGIKTQGDILFIGSSGEEGLGNLRGVRHLFRRGGPKIDRFIAIDGGGLDRIVYRAVGSYRYRVTFEGPGGHSYGAFGRAHPHQALADAITRFKDAATPLTQGEGPKATFSVGRIGGGTSINSIPFESWMEVDMRSVDPRKLDALDAVFRTAVAEALDAENARRARDEPLTVTLDKVGDRPAGRGDPNSSLVRHAMAGMLSLGVEPRLAASSTDANIPIFLNVPAITLSRGGISRNAHAPNESWTNADPDRAIHLALLVTLAQAGLAP